LKIDIREYNKRDQEQLMELIDLSFEEEGLLNILKDSRFKFAYSAFAEDKLVGVAFGWKSSFHAYCTYFKILVNPLYTQSNVVEKLLSRVESLKTIDSPLQTSIWETSQQAKRVYEKSGFKEIRRTYMPTLRITDFKEKAVPYSEHSHILKSVADISTNNNLLEKLVLLVKRNYEATHKVNPVVTTGLEEWKSLVLSADLIGEGSYVFLDADEKDIIAYSFLHESDDENSYDLGWCGCSSSPYKELIQQLIFQQIKYSINNARQALVGEFDTTDSSAMEVLESFPFTPSPTWITYQKK
jgi:hypothetical protein